MRVPTRFARRFLAVWQLVVKHQSTRFAYADLCCDFRLSARHRVLYKLGGPALCSHIRACFVSKIDLIPGVPSCDMRVLFSLDHHLANDVSHEALDQALQGLAPARYIEIDCWGQFSIASLMPTCFDKGKRDVLVSSTLISIPGPPVFKSSSLVKMPPTGTLLQREPCESLPLDC